MNTLKNQIRLVGNLGKDVLLKEFENGTKLARVPLATSDYYKRADGETVQQTQWHNLVAWGKTAELMERTLLKGQEVAVTGKLVYRSFEDTEGQTKYTAEVIVQEFLRLSKNQMPF